MPCSQLALNEFADLTTEEFVESKTGFRAQNGRVGRVGMDEDERGEFRPKG